MNRRNQENTDTQYQGLVRIIGDEYEKDKKKVLFIVPSLRGGGAERVMLTLLRHLDRGKFDLALALIQKEGQYLRAIPRDIHLYDLKAKRVRKSFIKLLKLIWRTRPDVLFSTLGHLNLALILLKPFLPKETKLIVREANTVSENVRISGIPKMWTFLYKTLYKQADVIICQSKYMQQDLEENFDIPNKKMVQIYNPVDIVTIQKHAGLGGNPYLRSNSSPNIVAIGRLTYQKGFDRLIDSIPQLLEIAPKAKLWILGQGPLEAQLKQRRDQLSIQDHVEFVGFQHNPYRWVKHADLFVLSSYFEGLPNVLLEAIACKCPVVAIKHPGGTKEIMELLNLSDRFLTQLKYNDKLFRSIESDDLLEKHFGLSKIVQHYESILLR